MTSLPRLRPQGDGAFLIQFGDTVDPEVSAVVRAQAALLDQEPGVAETVPGFATLLVILTADADRRAFIQAINPRLAALPPGDAAPGRAIDIPVAYGPPLAPDLEDVARRSGLSSAEVVRLHAAGDYLVYMVGFAPGFPYMGILPEALRLPRRSTPRTRVAAGAVAIADILTGIYPQQTPGGWHLIGWTPTRLFDPAAARPSLLEPGDRVRFVPATGAKGRPRGPVPSNGPLEPVPQADREPDAGDRGVPVLRVLEPGLAVTVQDRGRFGYRRLGVPWSGPMDPAAHAAANQQVGNGPDAAALEVTWPPPVLQALAEVPCAVAGPGWHPVVDGTPRPPGEIVVLGPDQALTLGRTGRSTWGYLAVRGGIAVPRVMGSRSAYLRGGFGGLAGRSLWAGDVLRRAEEAGEAPDQRFPPSSPRTRADSAGAAAEPVVLRVLMGPQEDQFTSEGVRRLLQAEYRVTVRMDRTGYRLEGPPIEHAGPPEVLPEGVMPGAVQVPGDRQPIVLMPDGPTTGGYPKVATVIAADLPLLAQAPPGARVRFRAVTIADVPET